MRSIVVVVVVVLSVVIVAFNGGVESRNVEARSKFSRMLHLLEKSQTHKRSGNAASTATGATSQLSCPWGYFPCIYSQKCIRITSMNCGEEGCFGGLAELCDDTEASVFEGAIQRDTYPGANANRAIDGNTATLSCTTMNAVKPWWAVELVKQSPVYSVKLFNDPGPNKAYRLDNFYVWLSNTKPIEGQALPTDSYVLCDQYKGTVAPGAKAFVNCNTKYDSYNTEILQRFKYVIIQSSLTTEDALCLGEVEVFTGESEWVCATEFQCADLRTCVDLSKVCDGSNDCSDGSDEDNCGSGSVVSTDAAIRRCPWGFYPCIDSSKCIRITSTDCNSDGCFNFLSEPCGENTLQCLSSFSCANELYCRDWMTVCNGSDDCPDGSDESFCDE